MTATNDEAGVQRECSAMLDDLAATYPTYGPLLCWAKGCLDMRDISIIEIKDSEVVLRTGSFSACLSVAGTTAKGLAGFPDGQSASLDQFAATVLMNYFRGKWMAAKANPAARFELPEEFNIKLVRERETEVEQSDRGSRAQSVRAAS